jgi:hypothetical protein
VRSKKINFSEAYSFADYAVTAVRDPSSIGPGDVIGDFFGFRELEFMSVSNSLLSTHYFMYSFTVLTDSLFNIIWGKSKARS